MRTLLVFVVLAIYWWLLSGQTKLFFVGTGVVCCAFTVFVCRRLKILDDELMPIHAIWGLIWYLPYLLWQIILSNLHVAKVIWSPGLQINPKVVKIPTKAKTGFGIMTYANSITLTPGTVTITVDNDEMLVHALDDQTADDLVNGDMDDMVLKMEGSDKS